MSSTQDKLAHLIQTKNEIKKTLEYNRVNVDDTDTFRSMGPAINNSNLDVLKGIVRCDGETSKDYIDELVRLKTKLYEHLIIIGAINITEDELYNDLIQDIVEITSIPKTIRVSDTIPTITIKNAVSPTVSFIDNGVSVKNPEENPVGFTDVIPTITIESVISPIVTFIDNGVDVTAETT